MNKKDISTKKVLCFGELLLRMSPLSGGVWISEHHMPAYVGGAELNVATALARWGVPVCFMTALPDHSLTQDLIQYLLQKGIDTSRILRFGERVGIYYLPQGKDLKNAGVIYDRAHSSFSRLKPGLIDWEELLSDVCWVHMSAINAALNPDLALVCGELLRAAEQLGIPASMDLNYRSKLWQYGKRPVEIMPDLVKHCELVMGNIWAAESLLGIPLCKDLIADGTKQSYLEHAAYTSKAIAEAFPKVKAVANTFRFDHPGNTVRYYATLYTDRQLYASDEIEAVGIKDKVGSGDCFMAGLLYGFREGWDFSKIVGYAATAAVGKMYEASDATSQTAEHILSGTSLTGHKS